MPTLQEVNVTNPPLHADAPDTRQRLQAAQDDWRAQLHLPVWCITVDPSDFPGQYVARLHLSSSHALYVTSMAVVGHTLEAVRAVLPENLVRIPRSETDDPKIAECWL